MINRLFLRYGIQTIMMHFFLNLGMHQARVQTGNPGFSHSYSDNYELPNPGSSGSMHAYLNLLQNHAVFISFVFKLVDIHNIDIIIYEY